MRNGRRLFLRAGEEVHHLSYPQWGIGVVAEVMTSIQPGGTALLRITFPDGCQRTFGNDLDQESCCYYFGVRPFFRDEPAPLPRVVGRKALGSGRRRR